MSSLCQSCSMELSTDSVLGTNEDGSRSREYCNCCFRHGKFINPKLTLKEEIESVTLHIMAKRRISKDVAKQIATNILPKLKRWKTSQVVDGD